MKCLEDFSEALFRFSWEERWMYTRLLSPQLFSKEKTTRHLSDVERLGGKAKMS